MSFHLIICTNFNKIKVSDFQVIIITLIIFFALLFVSMASCLNQLFIYFIKIIFVSYLSFYNNLIIMIIF